MRPPLRRGLQWRLISHLSLNYLSIVQGGRDALQEILKLYDFTDDPVDPQADRRHRRCLQPAARRRVVSQHGIVFCRRGCASTWSSTKTSIIGIGAFLFAAVLERFLGLYTAINSFTQLTVRTTQRKGDLKQWPPRSGEQILL